MKIGDKIRVKGPKGQMRYTPGLVREFGMIAGGTGITPMLQIVRAIMKNPRDKTKVSLIFANVNEEDILLRKELEELAEKEKARFKLHFVLNNPPAQGWKGGVGFVTEEMIKEYCPKPAKNIKILMCGPPPMISAMKKHCAVSFLLTLLIIRLWDMTQLRWLASWKIKYLLFKEIHIKNFVSHAILVDKQ
jgi:cytochrome-b5 reductase